MEIDHRCSDVKNKISSLANEDGDHEEGIWRATSDRLRIGPVKSENCGKNEAHKCGLLDTGTLSASFPREVTGLFHMPVAFVMGPIRSRHFLLSVELSGLFLVAEQQSFSKMLIRLSKKQNETLKNIRQFAFLRFERRLSLIERDARRFSVPSTSEFPSTSLTYTP